MPDIFGSRFLQSGAVWTGIAGGAFGGLAFLVSFVLLQYPALRIFAIFPDLLPYFVAPASFLVSSVCWWLVVERPRRMTRARGVIIGLVTGLVAHPVTWTLVITYDAVKAGASPYGPGLVPAVFVYSIFSLGFTGVLTMFIGAICGIALILGRERTVH